MNNIYLIENDSPSLLEMKIEEILNENNLSRESLVTYDMDEVDVSHAILDLDTYSFFNEKKVVWCKSATFLTASKSEINHDIAMLTKYLNNPNPQNILIISCSKADSKKNIVKLLKKQAKCIDIDINLNDYVKKMSDGYKVSASTISYLLENTGSDIERITNELNKLLEFKSQEKEINNKDIDLVVIKKIDSNIFDLIDAIISKNKQKSLMIYQNMINYGEDVFRILISLANQIRLIYQVKVLRNLSNDEIASRLNLKNPKQVMAIRYKIDKYKESDLLDYLYKLALMDEEFKTGKSIDKVSFPVFIASL
jgi:DNA polymerase-3 subunit delta